jgi:hypothetical protein
MGMTQSKHRKAKPYNPEESFLISIPMSRRPSRSHSAPINFRPDSYLPPTIMRTDLTGVWSLTFPTTGRLPSIRLGQCSTYDDLSDSLIIAYGHTSAGTCLNDFWSFSLTSNLWLPHSYTLLSPRTRASSIRVDREFFIFGGVCNLDYFSDLHSINLDTGVLTRYDSSSVSPRCRSLLFSYDRFLFIFGGFNGRTIDSFHEFNLTNGRWTNREHSDQSGRPGASVAQGSDGFSFYIFGNTSGHPLLRFNARDRMFDVIKCGGLAPPPELTDAMIAAFGKDWLIVIGGVRESDFTYVYGVDIVRFVWFIIGVLPDEVSVTLADGNIKNGLFQLPRQHSAAFAYSPKRRAVVAVMGSRLLEPPPVNTIVLADAIAVLTLKRDLLEML